MMERTPILVCMALAEKNALIGRGLLGIWVEICAESKNCVWTINT